MAGTQVLGFSKWAASHWRKPDSSVLSNSAAQSTVMLVPLTRSTPAARIWKGLTSISRLRRELRWEKTKEEGGPAGDY